MYKQEVIDLMSSSNSEEEWIANCDRVKQDNFGKYPSFWYPTIVLSGLSGKIAAKWNGTDETSF